MEQYLRVYIAWPNEQLTVALRAAGQLFQDGHVPIMQGCAPDWNEMDRWRLEMCSCIVRFPGESTKSDFAVDCAKVLGLPVYFSLQACLDDLPKLVEA